MKIVIAVSHIAKKAKLIEHLHENSENFRSTMPPRIAPRIEKISTITRTVVEFSANIAARAAPFSLSRSCENDNRASLNRYHSKPSMQIIWTNCKCHEHARCTTRVRRGGNVRARQSLIASPRRDGRTSFFGCVKRRDRFFINVRPLLRALAIILAQLFIRQRRSGASRAIGRFAVIYFSAYSDVSIIPVSLQDIIRVASDLFLRSIRPESCESSESPAETDARTILRRLVTSVTDDARAEIRAWISLDDSGRSIMSE